MRRLELTAPEDALVRRATTLLEDAFRTSSLPGADDDRVVLVRRLDLGAFHVSESPAAIALEAERAFKGLATEATHATNPVAASAPVVFFCDDVEPCILLAERVARGDPASEWFWPLAVPGWSAALARDAGLRLLLFRALETSAGVAGGVRLVQQLAGRGAADTLLGALRPQDGLAFLRACGWSDPFSTRVGEPALQLQPDPLLDQPLSRASLELLARWADAWCPRDERTTWLAHVLVVAGRSAWLGSAQLPVLALRAVHAGTGLAPGLQLERRAEEKRVAWGAEAHTPPGGPRVPRVDSEPYENRESGIEGTEQEPSLCMPDAGRPQGREEARTVSETIEPGAASARRTLHAGLLFLVSLLARLEVDSVLRAQPELVEREFFLKLMHRIAALLDISAEDPAVASLPSPSEGLEFEAAERAVAGRWLRAMRRWVATEASMSLRALVRRPGRVAATPTHIDVHFDHRQADVRIRRAGLDVDPGWVLWFGRVLHFHYHYGELSRAE